MLTGTEFSGVNFLLSSYFKDLFLKYDSKQLE